MHGPDHDDIECAQSGSESVYLNGVLLTRAPIGSSPGGDTAKGDYRIDYNAVNGTTKVYLHEGLSMDRDDVLVVNYFSGALN